MRYYCNSCLLDIKQKSKYSHIKSKAHKDFEDIDIKDVDEILNLYV